MTNATNNTATVSEGDAGRDVRIAGHMLDASRVLLADAQKAVAEAQRAYDGALEAAGSVEDMATAKPKKMYCMSSGDIIFVADGEQIPAYLPRF